MLNQPTIIGSDDFILAVNKPAGLTVHAKDAGDNSATLVDYIKDFTIDDDYLRPGIVHRLDKNTSGVVIIARNKEVKSYLQNQFKKRSVKKVYVAAVHGLIEPPKAKLDLPIGRHVKNPLKRAVRSNGKRSITQYSTLEQKGNMSLLDVRPLTGRMHQIRVHLSYLGYPVVGDDLYGSADGRLNRHFLHARSIKFNHPVTKQSVTYSAELSEELNDFWYNQH